MSASPAATEAAAAAHPANQFTSYQISARDCARSVCSPKTSFGGTSLRISGIAASAVKKQSRRSTTVASLRWSFPS
jgi:hypothetical protein